MSLIRDEDSPAVLWTILVLVIGAILFALWMGDAVPRV